MDSTLGCVARWMPRQRWYTGKSRQPSLRLVADWEMAAHADAEVRTLLIADDAALPSVLYQVPVVIRPTADVAITDHVVGSPRPGVSLIDGPHDRAYTDALARLLAGHPRPGDGLVGGRPIGAVPPDPTLVRARVLGAEQSNTSIVYTADGASPPVICKLFRTVYLGVHPDVEVQSALSAAGSPYVAPVVGWIEARWDGSAESGALALAQQFFPDARDGWTLALDAAARDRGFVAEAADLAIATASVHAGLADRFATEASTDESQAALGRAWQRRLATAIAEVPALASHREAIAGVYRRAHEIPWPSLQRVHGDLHLGQALLVPDRGWLLLDFEGEPLRPMSERTLPDLALRDVAGMLRSFDYVAGSLGLDDVAGIDDPGSAWAADARDAYLRAYADAADLDLEALRPLLDALELDKAVYEAIYEARSRPTWVAIPQRAIVRLVGAHRTRT